MCELIILPLLSTLVNHTKTILVQNLVFCMISRDSGMQCSGFVIPLMCKILNRVWLRNYIGLHSSVTTPQKSLLSQLIGLGLGHTRFDTISQHRKPPHTSHAPSICFHTSLEAKKSTWIDILLLVAGHTFSRHLNKALYSVFFLRKKYHSSITEPASFLYGRATEMATFLPWTSWKPPRNSPQKGSGP